MYLLIASYPTYIALLARVLFLVLLLFGVFFSVYLDLGDRQWILVPFEAKDRTILCLRQIFGQRSGL